MRKNPFYIVQRRVRASSIRDALRREVKDGEVTDVWLWRKDDEPIKEQGDVGFNAGKK